MRYHVFISERGVLIPLYSGATFDTFAEASDRAARSWDDALPRNDIPVYEDDGGSWWKYLGCGAHDGEGGGRWYPAQRVLFMQAIPLPLRELIERPVYASGYDPRNPPRDTN